MEGLRHSVPLSFVGHTGVGCGQCLQSHLQRSGSTAGCVQPEAASTRSKQLRFFTDLRIFLPKSLHELPRPHGAGENGLDGLVFPGA